MLFPILTFWICPNSRARIIHIHVSLFSPLVDHLQTLNLPVLSLSATNVADVIILLLVLDERFIVGDVMISQTPAFWTRL